ncbi:MAG: S1C family serine protease, partial [Planctomycetota bacterium]
MTFQTMLVVGATLAFAMLLSPTQVAHAQDALSLEELEQLAFEDATRFVQDSVVQVETFGGAEIVNRQLTIQGPSSGTVLTADGWIVTSTFQFKGQPASITVVLPSKERKSARLVARDFSRELALLKIDVDEPLKPATLSDRPGWMIGQWALAIGKTFDPSIGSCSAGILSAQGRIWDKAIQTDAKISPQNYGGPLSDLNGHVMGILTPINPGIVTEGEVEQWYDSGIGFAVPLADVLDRLPRMQKGEDVYPGKVGIRWRGDDEYNQPVVIDGVTPGSPASDAGLEVDDKIVAVGPSLEK